jgi:hypothetical protein
VKAHFIGVDLARDRDWGCRAEVRLTPEGVLVIERILWEVPCAERANSGPDTTDNGQHRPALNE